MVAFGCTTCVTEPDVPPRKLESHSVDRGYCCFPVSKWRTRPPRHLESCLARSTHFLNVTVPVRIAPVATVAVNPASRGVMSKLKNRSVVVVRHPYTNAIKGKSACSRALRECPYVGSITGSQLRHGAIALAATQICTPSKVIPNGAAPTEKMPNIVPSLGRSFFTSLFATTQTLVPSNKIPPCGPLPTEKVPRLAPSLARSFVTLALSRFPTQILAPSKAIGTGKLPTRKVPRLAPSLARSFVTSLEN